MKQLIIFFLGIFLTAISHGQNTGVNTNTPKAYLDVNGDVAIRFGTMNLPNFSNNDVNTTTDRKSIYRVNGGLTGTSISGFEGGVDGRMITLVNNGVGQMLIENTNVLSLSLAANQIITGSGNNISIPTNGFVSMIYDAIAGRWRVTNYTKTDPMPVANTWLTNGNHIYNANAGNVGIGTTSPTSRLDLTTTTTDTNVVGIRSVLNCSQSVSPVDFYDGVQSPAGYFESNAGQAIYAKVTGGFNISTEAIKSVAIQGVASYVSSDVGPHIGVQGYGFGDGVSSIGVSGIGGGIGSYAIGIYGQPKSGSTATNVYAGYFQGNANVTGTVSAASKAFKIDNPLNPEQEYLMHSCVESPDMMDIYNGNIVTSKAGEATVVLPEYFGSLNKDFRYQLTVIGSFAQAMVAKEVYENRFVIKTNQPDVKVSWQITGIRNDPYAQKFRIKSIVPKIGFEKGKYINPEAYNITDKSKIISPY